MTMNELAKLANVSVSTVSKAFSDAADVSEDTKDLIFAIAKEQGCFGKFYKGKYHKKIIAIICHELKGNYYTAFVDQLKGLIEASDNIAIVATDNFNKAQQAELIEYFSSYLKVDGIIVFGLTGKIKKGYDVPVVSVLSNCDSNTDCVKVDFKAAFLSAANLLIDYGHKKIGFIGEALTTAKADMFKKTMDVANITDYKIVQSQKRFEEAGIDGVKQLLDSGFRPTALVCAYDHIAFGAIRQLKTAGYKVPDDVSVIGLDNISMDEYTETTVTSVGANPSDICTIAWDLLQKKMKNPYFKSNQKIIVSSELVVRESVKRVE